MVKLAVEVVYTLKECLFLICVYKYKDKKGDFVFDSLKTVLLTFVVVPSILGAGMAFTVEILPSYYAK